MKRQVKKWMLLVEAEFDPDSVVPQTKTELDDWWERIDGAFKIVRATPVYSKKKNKLPS